MQSAWLWTTPTLISFSVAFVVFVVSVYSSSLCVVVACLFVAIYHIAWRSFSSSFFFLLFSTVLTLQFSFVHSLSIAHSTFFIPFLVVFYFFSFAAVRAVYVLHNYNYNKTLMYLLYAVYCVRVWKIMFLFIPFFIVFFLFSFRSVSFVFQRLLFSRIRFCVALLIIVDLSVCCVVWTSVVFGLRSGRMGYILCVCYFTGVVETCALVYSTSANNIAHITANSSVTFWYSTKQVRSLRTNTTQKIEFRTYIFFHFLHRSQF